MSDNDRQTPETDAQPWFLMRGAQVGVNRAFARRMERERDEAIYKLKFIDVQACERSHDKRWAFRLRRMVRIALGWRREAYKWMRDHAEARLDETIAKEAEVRAIARADRAEAALAELRSLWSCEEPERQRAVDAWRAATGCKDGTPSVGAMLAFFRRGCHQLAVKREAIEAATKEPDHA